MLAAERHHQILEALKERGSLRTKDVASDLDVTDETIRKDFELLEHQGLLVRSHGGAIPSKRSHPRAVADRKAVDQSRSQERDRKSRGTKNSAGGDHFY